MNNKQNIYNRIKQMLQKKGLKNKDLSDYLNLSSSTVTNWKLEKSKPTIEHIIKISEYLKCSTDYILKGYESNLNETDTQILKSYHNLPEESQNIINKILDIKIKEDVPYTEQKEKIG